MLFCVGNERRKDGLFCCMLFGRRAVRDLLPVERKYCVWSYWRAEAARVEGRRSCVDGSAEDINESLIRFDSE